MVPALRCCLVYIFFSKYFFSVPLSSVIFVFSSMPSTAPSTKRIENHSIGYNKKTERERERKNQELNRERNNTRKLVNVKDGRKAPANITEKPNITQKFRIIFDRLFFPFLRFKSKKLFMSFSSSSFFISNSMKYLRWLVGAVGLCIGFCARSFSPARSRC